MRETRKSNHPPPPTNDEKKADNLRQLVEQEYSKIYRQQNQIALKTARHHLRHVANSRPPPLSLSSSDLPLETNGFLFDDHDEHEMITVLINDGNNQNQQKSSVVPTILPGVTSIRELISYVPTLKNLAMRGHLTGIPYLGDKFDADDQQIINSISGESSKETKGSRKKKLDDQSLEILYQTIRSNETLNRYSNEELVEAIIQCHRDSSARSKLQAFACSSTCRTLENIDTCETIDVDLNDLVVQSWCARFCARCYTYNCLLHTEKSIHLPLPKHYSINFDSTPTSCSSNCYKHEREHLKRSLSPTHHYESSHSNDEEIEPMENVKKRPRKTTPNENIRVDHEHFLSNDQQKKFSAHFLTRIENHMSNHLSTRSNPNGNDSFTSWTLTDRSLFRLFYFLLDGDLCLIQQLFHDNRTCQEIYQQFIFDAKFFADHLSIKDGTPLVLRRPYRRRMLEGATRAFLLHIKKHSNSTQKSTTTLKPAYQPCLHDGPCTKSNPNCHCMKTGTFCEKFCHCSVDCPHRFPGCACKGACLLNNCLCCAEGRECDPDLCHKCGASSFPSQINEIGPIMKIEPVDEGNDELRIERKSLPSFSRRPTTTTTTRVKTSDQQSSSRQHSLRACRNNETSYKTTRPMAKRTTPRSSLSSQRSTNSPSITCANISLQRKLYKQILIAESDVAGYGAFLGSSIAQPGDLIAEYTGEIISEEEADRRGRLYDKQACSYLFNLDNDRCVDARQYGGKIRFANHSSKPNCVPKIKLVNGDYRIGIYAKQTIYQGEELFFEYMYDAHHRQQFVNNERVEDSEQHGLTILKRFGDNFLLVRPS